MKTILVSFIGRGIDSGSGYRTVDYKFANGDIFKTSFFGSALLRNLKAQKQPVEKWLIMGTAQSNWCDLPYMFDEDDCLAFQDRHCEFIGELKADADRSIGGGVSDADLQKWQKLIADESPDTEIICRKVGNATEQESFDKIIQSLLEVVEDGSRIVFDVTHGYRTQPIVTGFILMYLRWLKNIESLELFYGGEAAEIRGQVIDLSFCNDLLKATEAVAVREQTGNYAAIGEQLNISETFKANLQKLVFADETHRPNRQLAGELRREIEKNQSGFNPVKSSLAGKLKNSLDWSGEASYARQLKRKAETAFKYKQYFKAVITLWEAVKVACCESCRETDFLNPNIREQCFNEIYERRLNSAQIIKIDDLRSLRNTLAHGTENRREIEDALVNPKKFEEIFNGGKNVLEDILAGRIGSS